MCMLECSSQTGALKFIDFAFVYMLGRMRKSLTWKCMAIDEIYDNDGIDVGALVWV